MDINPSKRRKTSKKKLSEKEAVSDSYEEDDDVEEEVGISPRKIDSLLELKSKRKGLTCKNVKSMIRVRFFYLLVCLYVLHIS